MKKYKIYVFLYSLLFFGSFNMMQSQTNQATLEEALEKADAKDFFSIQKEINQYFEENQDPSGEKKWRRQEWLLEPRLYPSGEIVNLTQKANKAYKTYEKSHPKMPVSGDRSPHGSWSSLGPNSWTAGFGGNGGQGRVNSIDVHPSNSNIIYVGTSNGGIWRTTNGGSAWSNVSPNLPLLAIADLEINYNSTNTIYALTGDGDPNPGPGTAHSQAEIRSIGILKSTNSGSTWTTTGFTFETSSSPVIPTKLLMHPTNPNIQFVASENGIYKTTNGWISYTKEFSSLIFDIEFKPGDPTTMYASGSTRIYKSTNTGDDWTQSTDTDLSVASGATRIELAVTPNYSSLVYAMAGDWSNGSIAFFASYSSANDNSWVIKDQTTDVIGAFATYCIGLYVNPTNYNLVFGGGVGIWKSTNEGLTGSWSQINQSTVHADVHDIYYKSGVLYVACDGGLFKSTNDGASWTDLSPGIGNTEIYRIAGTEASSNLYYMGLQDNGTYRRTIGTNFTHVLGADGMTCIIDPNNSNNVFATTQNGGLNRSTNGGTSFSWLMEPGGSGAWISPVIMDPNNSNRIFLGKSNCYRSSSSGASGTFESIGSPWSGTLNCLAQGTSNSNRLYASAGSQIYRSNNALAAAASVTWTSISSGLPGNFITGIEVDPTNSLRVFVSISGYSDGNKVFMSLSGGDPGTWVNISGTLPNVPVNCIAFENDGSGNYPLYIGTDIGVFYRDNSIGDWIYFSDFLPNVIISDLYINHTANTITAGTFGRGLWRSDLKTGCNTSISFSSLVTHGGEIHYSYNSSITSSAKVSPNIGTEIYYMAGNFIDLKESFQAPSTALFEGKIGPCPN
jgi:hypothetical protein